MTDTWLNSGSKMGKPQKDFVLLREYRPTDHAQIRDIFITGMLESLKTSNWRLIKGNVLITLMEIGTFFGAYWISQSIVVGVMALMVYIGLTLLIQNFLIRIFYIW